MEEKKENVKVSCYDCIHKEYCKYEGLHKTKKDFSLALCSEEHFPVIEVELKCKYYEYDTNKRISEIFNKCYECKEINEKLDGRHNAYKLCERGK